MKFPKRLSELLKRKQAFIDSQRVKLESTIVRLQSQLFSDIIAELIPELDTKDGMILETTKNYRLLSVLDKTYKDFQNNSTSVLLNQVVQTTSRIGTLSGNYFKAALTADLMARFESVVARTDKLINLRLGLDGGKLVRGGFLKSLFESNTVGTELKNMTAKAITSGVGMKDFTKQLRDAVMGVDKKLGAMERQFQRYTYDIYQQYDRAYNQELGNEFGFRYFIYQGGLIEDSREFCVEHNGKVFSKEETKEWATWVSPTTGEVPSYLGYPGYDPLIDFGGYNCRHFAGWIDDDLAKQMRPELQYSQGE